MRELNVRFTIDNAAFKDDNESRNEVARILGRIAALVLRGSDGRQVMNVDGVQIGEWSITETDGDQ